MWYINFSPFFDIGQTIKTLSNSNDTLLVVPQNSLIYWESGLAPSSPYFFTVNFMNKGEMANRVREKWLSTLPVFFYIEKNPENTEIFRAVEEDFIPLEKDGKSSNLFIRKDKMDNIDQEQWTLSQRYGYFKPKFN